MAMMVVKRDGRTETVTFDKIQSRISKLCYSLHPTISAPLVAQKVIQGVYDGVTTAALDDLAAETAAYLTMQHPDYARLAARISVSNLHKMTEKSFSAVMDQLHGYVNPRNGQKAPLIADEVHEIIMTNASRLDAAIMCARPPVANRHCRLAARCHASPVQARTVAAAAHPWRRAAVLLRRRAPQLRPRLRVRLLWLQDAREVVPAQDARQGRGAAATGAPPSLSPLCPTPRRRHACAESGRAAWARPRAVARPAPMRRHGARTRARCVRPPAWLGVWCGVQMLMRVSVGIHKADLDKAIETYHLMSDRWFTHATPTMFNAGTPFAQMSSCFLLSMKDDSIEGIFETLKLCAQISKSAGGIGLAVTNIRAKGSYIKGSGGISNGLVPMLRVFDNTARYVDQVRTSHTAHTARHTPHATRRTPHALLNRSRAASAPPHRSRGCPPLATLPPPPATPRATPVPPPRVRRAAASARAPSPSTWSRGTPTCPPSSTSRRTMARRSRARVTSSTRSGSRYAIPRPATHRAAAHEAERAWLSGRG
jgi:hypothetical protein